MARWMLLCPNCNSKFLHSQIAPNALQESYRDPFRVGNAIPVGIATLNPPTSRLVSSTTRIKCD
jgi:hypothetical protein